MTIKNLIFLSYKREDLNDLTYVHNVLRANGIRIWSDLEYLPPGSNTTREIQKAIFDKCVGFLIYVTPQSLKSDFIWNVEIPAAYEKSKRENGNFLLIPIIKGHDLIEPFRQKSLSKLGCDLTNRNGFVFESGLVDISTINDLAARLIEHLIRTTEYTPIEMFTYKPIPTCPPDHLVLDWSNFFSDTHPTKEEWRDVLTPSLKNIRRALLRKNKPQRDVWLPTRIHLSAALAYGWIFRETRGFNLIASDKLKQENPEDIVDVNQFAKMRFDLVQGSRRARNLFLGISIAKDVHSSIERTKQQGYRYRAGLFGTIENLGRNSILNTTHAKFLAERTVEQLVAMRTKFQTSRTDLFISSSVQYAAYLGWYLNACGHFTYWQYRNKTGDAIPSCDLDSLWDGDT